MEAERFKFPDDESRATNLADFACNLLRPWSHVKRWTGVTFITPVVSLALTNFRGTSAADSTPTLRKTYNACAGVRIIRARIYAGKDGLS